MAICRAAADAAEGATGRACGPVRSSVWVRVRTSRAVPSPSAVRQLAGALQAVSQAAATGTSTEAMPELPDDETLKPVTEAVRALLGMLRAGGRLATPGSTGLSCGLYRAPYSNSSRGCRSR